MVASSYATGSQLKQRLQKIEKEGNCDPEDEIVFLVLCRVIVPTEIDSPRKASVSGKKPEKLDLKKLTRKPAGDFEKTRP